ncbi:acyl-CoA dehydrogenase family protein [Leucobacter allii]|uniref:Acyl-CoA dehydrogenase family protein n=1 Tax=Leucobacter allii TaxID=2932247 RepID=A0ABY4FMI7_9MICO|nr:acyl-CoA dehydrogenase family protein [Leucobacter allii]UOQ57481.1 acyl-CoA dehydrogenase family protein [Leucobacter allii]
MTTPRDPALAPSEVFGIDALRIAETMLSPAGAAALAELQRTLDSAVRPLVNEAWETATMPPGIIGALAPLGLMAPDGMRPEEADSTLFSGLRNFVLARTDVSVATVYNAQSGLFRSTVRLGGSDEQIARWDPAIRDFSFTGAFALTEPEHGSDIAGGLATTATRTGDEWRISGRKRWIGGAGAADALAVFARSAEDGEVKCFMVPRDAAGVSLETITGKVSLRPMQNAEITLSDVRVPESARLQRIDSWRDVARIMGRLRSDVAWIAAGLQSGALDAAVRYVREREQFGRPLAGFQLIQEKLARMAGNVTASLAFVTRLSQLQDAGTFTDENSSLAKMWVALRARETAALGREIVGGNGILLEHDVARFFADAEAVYSYEGTHEVTSLIVGRGLTGVSAFT